jgi:hypothetical protein
MSGPKVVRIVTREELVLICRGELAILNTMLREWERVGQRNDVLAQDEIELARARQLEISALLRTDRFVELQKAARREVAFLQRDLEARLVRAAAKAASERAASRRLAGAARAVLTRLEASPAPVPAKLRQDLESLASGRSKDTAAITRALTLLEPADDVRELTEQQRLFAQALQDGPEERSIEQWIQAQQDSGDAAAFVRLERQLAELTALLGKAATQEFERKAAALADAPASRRAMLLDTLQVELARAVANARERIALQRDVAAVAAELEETGAGELVELAAELRRQLDAPVEALRVFVQHARALRERYHADVAAQARRQAVLTGLAALGYQVTEQMQTAWVQDGKVVLRNAVRAGYGMEISGDGRTARLQVRAVAFRAASAPADRARDVDAETLWCSDIKQLNKTFAEQGGEIVVERALEVGEKPIKVVEDAHAGAVEAERREPNRRRMINDSR